MHGDTPPSDAGSAIAGAYLNLLGHAVGWPSPEGGAGAAHGRAVRTAARGRGELRCDARVARVLVRPAAASPASSSTAASASARRS